MLLANQSIGNGSSALVKSIADEVARRQMKVMQTGQTSLNYFVPSVAAEAQKHGGWRPQNQKVIAASHAASQRLSTNPNYQGDYAKAMSRNSAVDPDQNTSLWVTGLPPNVSHRTLLVSIHDIGQIYSCVINKPGVGPHGQTLNFAAAKLEFFTRQQAERMYEFGRSGRWKVLGGVIRNVRWNDHACEGWTQEGSRCIKITGPAELMHQDYWKWYLGQKIQYDIETIIEGEPRNGVMTTEWRFGSFRCQACFVYEMILRELADVFEVEFVPDPCSLPAYRY